MISPYMEAQAQRGIIDTSQLQGSTAAVARWGGVYRPWAGGGLEAREAGAGIKQAASSNVWSSCGNPCIEW